MSDVLRWGWGLLALFMTLSVRGQDCADQTIDALPYALSSTTCGAGNNYNQNNACNSWQITGEDLTFAFMPASNTCVRIALSGYTMGAAGIIVTNGCPDAATSTCIGNASSDGAATSLELVFSAQAGVTYYITLGSSTWFADCIDFDLTIDNDCPQPTTADCIGAINMCSGYYSETNAPSGTGNYNDVFPANGCAITTIANMGWYQLTTQTAGVLKFTLTPNSTDDYDWMLFNITGASCDQIATNPDLLVSCNTYGETGNNGQTGISTASGGVGNANGPGNFNGPPFNADLPVEAGETYVLMISNWSGTPNGYELDFGASTATFIDDIPPQVVSAEYTCDGALTLVFSEYIDCNTVLPDYFEVTGEGGPYTVANVESNCDQGSAYTLEVTVYFDQDFPAAGGTFSVDFGEDELADVCGNFLEPVSVPVEVAPGMDLHLEVTHAACGDANGSITAQVLSGGTAPFQYSLNGGALSDQNQFENLAAGTYTIAVTDASGCSVSAQAEVELEGLEFTAGPDSYACQLSYTAAATLPAGYTGTWTADAGVQLSDPTSPNCMFTPPAPGIYTFTWTVTNGTNCTDQRTVDIAFYKLTLGGLTLTDPGCRDACDGAAEASINGGIDPAALDYTWSGGLSSSATPNKAVQLCPGGHTLKVATPEGCALTVPFELNNPAPIRIDSVHIAQENCPGHCDGSIRVFSPGASEYSFNGGLSFSTASGLSDACSGSYRLVLKNAGGCTRDTTLVLNVPPGPKARFQFDPHRSSTYQARFRFENFSADYNSLLWQFDYPDGNAFSQDEDPVYTYPEPRPGYYTVMLVAYDVKGCSDTLFQKVGIYEETRVYIPSSFTPNGDGVNDIFKPVLANITVSDYRLTLFDRWGNTVFDTREPEQGWNGEQANTGYFAPPGVYAYRIHIREAESGEPREWNGSVTLVR